MRRKSLVSQTDGRVRRKIFISTEFAGKKFVGPVIDVSIGCHRQANSSVAGDYYACMLYRVAEQNFIIGQIVEE